MDVKEAVKTAKTYVADLLQDEGVTNLGLEEIEHNDLSGEWLVTLGFSRPWDRAANGIIMMSPTQRVFRVVAVKDDGKVTSVRLRDGSSN